MNLTSKSETANSLNLLFIMFYLLIYHIYIK